MKFLLNEIKELWHAICAIRWAAFLLFAIGCIWLVHDKHYAVEVELQNNVVALENTISTYYEPQEEEYERTLGYIVEYITQTDMYLNVGGYDVRPEYYAPSAFDTIHGPEEIDFYNLLNTTEVFFNERAKYLDTIPSIWPLRYSRRMRITSPYGSRFSPFTGKVAEHGGIDIVSTYHAEILATAPGVVEEHWIWNDLFGKYIIINHEDRYRTHYAHLSSSYVHEGMTIERGQVIGRMGNTGLSAGEHLHYAIEVKDEKTGEWVFVDPQAFLLRSVDDESAPVASLASEENSEENLLQ